MRALSLLALTSLLITLAACVLRARPRHAVNRWFALLTWSIAGWVLGIGGVQLEAGTEFWGRFTFASASIMPATFLAFSRVFPTTSSWPGPRFLSILFTTGCALAGLSLTTTLVAYDISIESSEIQRKSGLLFPVFTTYFLGCVVAALGVFLGKWRRERGLARAQLQHLGIGLFVLAAGGITTNLMIPLITGRSQYSWIGPYFTLPLVALVAHAIIRHRLMDLRLFISRGLAYSLVLITISALIIGFIHLVVPGGKPQLSFLRSEFLVVIIVLLAMSSSPSQRFLSRVIDPYLYRGHRDHASALRGAPRQLSRLMQPRELATELRTILNDVLVPETFVMLVRPLEGDAFERITEDQCPIPDPQQLATLVTQRQAPSVLIVNPGSAADGTRAAHDALSAAAIELVVSLGRRGRVFGAVLLGPRRSGDAYFNRDLVLIESLAELASIALENALLYRQRIQMLEYSDRLLESLESAVVAVDDGGKITSFNPAAGRLLGLKIENRGSVLHGLPSEIGWALAIALRTPWHPREVEVAMDHDSRGLRYVILSTAVLHDDESRVTGALAVVTDISSVKALERNQRRVEHLAAMARFYAGIAHEIRNPLAAISNLISMLPDRFDDPEYRDMAARLLPLEVSRIVRLAERLRLMAPSEGGKLGAVSLRPLLGDIVAIHSPTAQEQQVRIQLHCPEQLPPILGDRGQLVQLFVNLLRNAIEAMPHGGTVTLEVDHLVGRNAQDAVIVRVTDEGSGIDPAVRQNIYEPFFTTKTSGTGLGLTICREIIDFHRARLRLVPRYDGPGTIAEVEFPCLTENPVLA